VQDRVALPGFVGDLAARIAGADLFVLPSRWEGLPNVVLEALALGVPVIASEEAGVEEIARAAPNAVSIVAVETAFAAAIARHRPTSAPILSLRPSLLPPEYRVETVAARFNELLLRIAGTQTANTPA
jgi:glycosyltransferase involved in cell wall biosynthesis